MSSFLRKAQRTAYLTSRALGDVRAAQRGPGPLARRVARREITRRGFALLNNGRGGRWWR